MAGLVKVQRRVLADRLITAADVAALTTDPQVEPLHVLLEALLATERPRSDGPDCDIVVASAHARSPSSYQ